MSQSSLNGVSFPTNEGPQKSTKEGSQSSLNGVSFPTKETPKEEVERILSQSSLNGVSFPTEAYCEYRKID